VPDSNSLKMFEVAIFCKALFAGARGAAASWQEAHRAW